MKSNDAYSEFCLTRRAMLEEWKAWVAQLPPEQDVQDELAATKNAMLQLAMLGGEHA